MRVELLRVGKHFGDVTALRDVTLAIPSGARVALIGPNGSGKTTLTRAILGVIAHEGEVLLDGLSAFDARARLAGRLAYVPQVAPQMAATVAELVQVVASVRSADPAQIWARARDLDLVPAAIAARPFRSLSGGMKQKVLLALAFAARASLHVLDEPTASLDASARARFYQLYERHAEGATLLLCSHRLEEIRHLVDHVVALADGRVVYHGRADAYLGERAIAVIELELGAAGAGDDWLRARGFVPGAAGWWRRQVATADKLPLLGEAMQVLAGRLRNVCVRDVERLEVDHAA